MLSDYPERRGGRGVSRGHAAITVALSRMVPMMRGFRYAGCLAIRVFRADVTAGVRCHKARGGSYSKAPNSPETMLSCRRRLVRKQFSRVVAEATLCVSQAAVSWTYVYQ